MRKQMDITLTKPQYKFHTATAKEVLYGGAAGGGKSHGQLVDAWLYAFKYPGSRQLILRRTFSQLDNSLIPKSHELGWGGICKYNPSKKTWTFPLAKNMYGELVRSVVVFGYSARDADVHQYDSSEWDVIRLDELTHFTEHQYVYMLSRLRGKMPYPRHMKSSTNPGNIGHAWVKRRFINPAPPGEVFALEKHTGVFIPAKVQDNIFLMQGTPEYIENLEALPEAEKRRLLYGDWDVMDGQYFSMWERDVHIIRPFDIPAWWPRYVSIDYGLDRFAALFFALDDYGRAYCYREYCESGLIVSQAAQALKAHTYGDDIRAYYAPPDLWNKHSDSGKSTAEIFMDCGIDLIRASNDRITGWRNVAEWLMPYDDEQGQLTAHVRFFDNCQEIIRCLPMLQMDEHRPEDVARDPHELTHAPDALRYFIAGRPSPAMRPAPKPIYNFDFEKPSPFGSYEGRGDQLHVI